MSHTPHLDLGIIVSKYSYDMLYSCYLGYLADATEASVAHSARHDVSIGSAASSLACNLASFLVFFSAFRFARFSMSSLLDLLF